MEFCNSAFTDFASSSHYLPKTKEHMGSASSQRGLSSFEIQFTLLDLENVAIYCIVQCFLVMVDATFSFGYL